jgi:hypothetical protein
MMKKSPPSPVKGGITRVGRGGGITPGASRMGLGLDFLDEVKRGSGSVLGSPVRRYGTRRGSILGDGGGMKVKRRLSFGESVAGSRL